MPAAHIVWFVFKEPWEKSEMLITVLGSLLFRMTLKVAHVNVPPMNATFSDAVLLCWSVDTRLCTSTPRLWNADACGKIYC